jgi:hypothetical protein
MGMFPCTLDRPHRFQGKASALYANLAVNGSTLGSKVRMCRPHAEEVREWFEAKMHLVAVGEQVLEEDIQASITCSLCEASGPTSGLFVNMYPVGEEDRAYYADVCATCARVVELRLHLSP